VIKDLSFNNIMENDEVEVEEEIVEETPELPEETVVERQTESLEDRKARLERQLSQTNKKLGIEPESIEVQPIKKSDGIGYGEKAFLVANGIKGEETKLVQEAMKRTGESLEQILENPYFQAKLKETRDLAMTADATPKGSRSNSIPTDSVEYWSAKPIEDVPQEMRRAVVNHRLKKEESKGKFYN